MDENEKVIFLLSSERSGSNLLTKVLNGHKDICGPSTKHLFSIVLRNIFRYGDYSKSKNWSKLVNDTITIINSTFSEWRIHFKVKDVNKNVKVGDLGKLLLFFYKKEARFTKKKHLFIKENHLYEFFPYLQKLYPNAFYIYLTRDPRDMAISWQNNPNHLGGILCGANQWKFDNQRFLLIENIIEKNKIYRIKYENLLKNFKKETKKLINFLSIEYDDSIKFFYKDETAILNSSKTKAWKNISKKIITDNSNKFLKILSSKQVSLIEKITNNEMRYLNYKMLNNFEAFESISDLQIQKKINKEKIKYPRKLDKNVIENLIIKKSIYSR